MSRLLLFLSLKPSGVLSLFVASNQPSWCLFRIIGESIELLFPKEGNLDFKRTNRLIQLKSSTMPLGMSHSEATQLLLTD